MEQQHLIGIMVVMSHVWPGTGDTLLGWRPRPLSDTERLLNNGHLLEPDDPKIMTSGVLQIAIALYIKSNLKSFRSTCIEVKIWAKIGMSSYPVDSARGQSLSLRNNVFFCWDAG